MNHELKILSVYFRQVVDGNKTFEIRDNTDRDFKKGDTVELQELGLNPKTVTGKRQAVKITYVTNYNQPANQVVFSFKLINSVSDL
ncbi:MAG: RNA-binding protein [Phycisphaera sp.]|nr:MAG: RNA-binding protein [Phycisphaera sp.]